MRTSAVSDESDALMSEPDVLTRWPALSKSGLRAARHDGRIRWVRGKRGSAWYRATAIETFISQELEQPCLDPDPGSSYPLESTGSPKNPAALDSIITGTTNELAERAGLASAQRILNRQKRGSQKSS